jgi:predicted DCC family thiol-disulfide oxidoreductase YuxK
MSDRQSSSEPLPIVFFDGECGFCHRTVRFLIERDPSGRLHFAHLQGDLARRALPAELRDVGRDGAVVLLERGNRISRRSEAALRALSYLPAPWRWLGALAALRPALPLIDVAYRFVARRRDRFFPRSESCPLPDAQLRPRFID